MQAQARAAERARAVADRLRVLLERRASGPDAEGLGTFARLLLQRDAGWIERLPDEEAAALVASAFRFFAGPGPDLRVRVVAPTWAEEGWDSSFTILETVMPDRPFIVDTIREILRDEGLAAHAFLHPIVSARRDATGRLEAIAPAERRMPRESFTHVALDPLPDAAARERLAERVRAGLEDVRLVTGDFPAMAARARSTAMALDARAGAKTSATATEAAAVAEFLRWLVDGAFVFLGYQEYSVVPDGEADRLVPRAGTALGLLRRGEPAGDAGERRVGPRLLAVTKTLAESPVHRRARMDDIGVRERDAQGRVVGERRFVGLFTSKAQAEEAAEVPLLRQTLRQVLAAEQVLPGSHDYKQIVAVFNALPKSDLLASSPEEVRDDVRAVLAAERADNVAVSLRAAPDRRRVSVLVVVPLERYSGEVQAELAELLAERCGGVVLETHVELGLRRHAVLHFAIAADAAAMSEERRRDVAAAVARLVRTWEERLADALLAAHGEETGATLAERFAAAFPDDYRAATPVEAAAADVAALAAVDADGVPRVTLRAGEGGAPAALRLYVRGTPPALSECVPVLEHLGLRALGSDQVRVAPAAGESLHVLTFGVEARRGGALDVAAVGEGLGDAMVAVLTGHAEDDVLNRLVLDAGLDWRAVSVLRAYAGYAAQIRLGPRALVQSVLADHPEPARLLFACFAARFAPAGAEAMPTELRERFLASLEAVEGLREDLLLRALLDVVEATVRTTFWAPGEPSDEVALKLRAADLAHLPPPRPLYEIWVQGPTVEGVHLRSGRVARGGIRLSDRPEDFRTEVLGLMRTQTVKNAVIVPVGAKGGFVVKGPRDPASIRRAYERFVGALLALTDDVVDGEVVHPRGLVVHDEPDPYLVVAADKGTATYSDTANAIALARGFWLGDAFASGGSHGYDHKKLGITARGAWECVRVHAREAGLDPDAGPFTVAGIGDMSGDVFGNALKRAPNVRLLAAFDHRHVFLDPDPDPARAFAERLRLFNEVRGWDAYDPAALSRGGAVVPRAAKKVVLSPEAAATLGLPAGAAVSGERLVQAVLTLDVDLLFNGGIGTYVAATGQSDAEVRDAVNDPVRVRASALRARIVAEGGNLGLTQQARIEYALAGGRINTDAIDNSAGVDLSDHEVNLKIALRAPLQAGTLSMEERNRLLAAVADEVVSAVVAHNRSQARLLGLDQRRSRTRLADFRELIATLERTANLDRALEALPDRDALRARRSRYLGLTRPELAVVTAYTKLALRAELLASSLPDDPFVEPYLFGYFPAAVRERFPDAVRAHPLRREITATVLANTIVDRLGTTFVYRVGRDTGATAAEVVRAAAIAWEVTAAGRLLAAVERGTPSVEADTTCHLALERIVENAAKWLLGNADATRPAADVAAELARAVARLRPGLAEWLVDGEAEAFQCRVSELEMAGLSPALSRHLATAEWLPGVLDVVTVASARGVEPEAAATAYYGLGWSVDFAWLFARLAAHEGEDRWERRAAAGLVDDVLAARRRLAAARLAGGDEPPARLYEELRSLIDDLRAAPRAGLAALHVVVRQLGRLADAAGPGRGG